jgi:hypothetical protein
MPPDPPEQRSRWARVDRLIAATLRPGPVLEVSSRRRDADGPLDHLGFRVLHQPPDTFDADTELGRLTAGAPFAAIVLDVAATGDLDRLLGTARRVAERSADGAVEPPLVVVALDVRHPSDDPFAGNRLSAVAASVGLIEVARDDLPSHDVRADHGRDPDDPASGDTTVAAHLRHLRAPEGASVVVRAYRAASPLSGPVLDAAGAPFLSVVVRTQGGRSTLTDTLVSLAAQHDDDLEVLLMVHHDDVPVVAEVHRLVDRFASPFAERVSVHHVVGGSRSRPLNAALSVARGRHVAILDDDDIVTGDWVSAFRRAADRHPGRVLHAACVVQWIETSTGPLADVEVVSGFEDAYPGPFTFLDSVRSNRSPSCSYAVPMATVRALGLFFDEELRVCEDWKFLMEAARVAGVSDDPAVTSVYRRWRGEGGSQHAETTQVWIDDHLRVVEDLDRAPTLLPPGSLGQLHRLYEHVEHLERELGLRQPDDPPHRSR